MNTHKNRIQQLQQYMTEQNIHAVIVPTADPHLSEYLPDYWQGRAWLSGFTGSAGVLVVTLDSAELWTDSRYWVQAEEQLAETGVCLHKLQRGVANHVDWLVAYCQQKIQQNHDIINIAIDGDVLSVFALEQLENALEPISQHVYIQYHHDPLTTIWQNRPLLPTAPIFAHHKKFVDKTITEKLALIRQTMAELNVTHHLVSSLDDIAWLTNLRGSDVEYNPVFLAHLLISQQQTILFVNQDKLTTELTQMLNQSGIELSDYQNIKSYLSQLNHDDRLLIDPNRVAIGTLAKLPDKVQIFLKTNPSVLLKAQKSAQDLEHIREAMRQDGTALCEFFAELEQCLAKGERVSEIDIDQMLIVCRSRQPNYISPSFATIAGFKQNGALPHYRATEESFLYLEGDGLLLIDSGGQYQNGTTDITRMVGIGTISEAEKRDVTLVLKSHIALATACFPEGISAPLIDAIARQPLWAEQMDYGHGTGHGVGYFLNVHEPPQAISYPTPATAERAMKLGMVTSNEPALYREGRWGIRIENVVANVAINQPKETEFGTYLQFETLTLCPIDTRLINPALLTNAEIDWLNAYHQKVYQELHGRLQGAGLAWLTERTQAI